MIKSCAHCGKEFDRKPSLIKKSKTGLFFCSTECRRSEQRIGGKLKVKHYGKNKDFIKKCPQCGTNIIKINRRFCSSSCYELFRKDGDIKRWLSGEWNGTTKNGSLSCKVRNFLLKESKYQCQKCGWCIPNPITGKPILTISHIDGNPTHNYYSNLEVLCFNCHTLTDSFGSLNKGNGRKHHGIRRYD
jgi:endogenous inhibitor of DNA gyrase (YacG/DUF329 family)